jgi:signal peptide peptidase SppA
MTIRSQLASSTGSNSSSWKASSHELVRLGTVDKVWAVREELLPELARLDGSTFVGSFDIDEAPEPEDQSSIAIIPLKGLLMSGGLLSLLFGIDPIESFRRGLAKAAGDDKVKHIVLDIDSPGGAVDGIPELANQVAQVKRKKPITAAVNTLAASAAYWIASQANEIALTPSGEAGSIGVYTIHRDISAAAEQAGLKFTVVSAGKYKTERNPYEPLSDSAQANLQEGVDDFYDMFVKDVARGRGATADAVRGGYGQGRVLTAKRAVRAGLADRIATLEEVVGDIQDGRRPPARRKAEMIEIEMDEVVYSDDEKERLFNMAELFGRDPQEEAADVG